MRVKGSFIYDDSERLVTAEEFWQFQKNTGNKLDLKLLGFAKPVIQIVLVNSRTQIKVLINSDIGTMEINEQELRSDYFIRDGYWIPTDKQIIEPLILLLDENSIEINSDIGLGKLFKLLSFARELGIVIDDQADLGNFRIDISDYHPIELALPLYEYQEEGVAWLNTLSNQELGGILADEMGLGKTAQAFGLIKQALDLSLNNILVVVPASLVYNWAREMKKFVPELNYYLHVGPNRSFRSDGLVDRGVVIVSYDLLVRDFVNFKKIHWDILICDEAQALKNHSSRRHKSVAELKSLRKFLVTGTPIENSLIDYWSLINIIRPGLLGSKRSFESLYSDSPVDARKLSRFAAPLVLRRTVANVAKDLPERIVIEEALAGTDQFNSIYEEVRKEAITNASNVLATITKLTQLCCYPRLIDKTYSDPHDAKLVRLLEILRSVQERGDQKAIIFSTYTESLDLIKAVVSRQLEPNFISTIDGRVSAQNRIAIIDSFEAIKGFAVLCIQPKAGGIGLNITAANHVIHFNRQWNPALESQATARAHRRGQLKTVFEYLMFYVGTIEEYISQTLSRKVELASEGTSQSVLEGSAKDINAALSLSPISTFSTLERLR